jgi:hypothetical protein
MLISLDNNNNALRVFPFFFSFSMSGSKCCLENVAGGGVPTTTTTTTTTTTKKLQEIERD